MLADSTTNTDAGAYRVLARRYRPTCFEDLIGQEAMVRTLSNAFEMGRIAHAFMLTGVRGIGKTTTARLLARALNYESDSCDKPSLVWEGEGRHCADIMESRHMDVMEMDAASHTGIADVREIIDSLQYAPTSARYKVYIIDEVHMLSTAAFNGLLKTLEEPPGHVKFIFATTEIRKVPVTILSRCQRFDLRRLGVEDMTKLLEGVAGKENITLAPGALSMLARAADGSARDALSLLDQAIAQGAEKVEEDVVRDMLGLADQMRVCDLFDALMEGNASKALDIGRELYDVGAEPMAILADLADLAHWLTRLRLAPEAGDKILASMSFGAQGEAWGRDRAEKLSLRDLNRVWQMLLKGMSETRMASKPIASMEMLMVRLAHAADMPHLDEALAKLSTPSTSTQPPAQTSTPTQASTPEQASTPAQASAPEQTSTPAPVSASGEDLRAEALKVFPDAVVEGEGGGR